MNFRKSISSIIAAIAILGSSMCFAQTSFTDGGLSGSWYNPGRDGEGIFLEVVRLSSGQRLSVAWFTYDNNGFQMWLTGAADIEGEPTSVTIPVTVTNGAKFGPAFNPEDVNRANWGTLTLTFNNCSQGLLSYASSAGFGTGAIELTRLTNLEQVQCNDPPPPSGTGITPGKWTGVGMCFYVSADGRTLTSEGSICDSGRAFDSDINSTDQNGSLCDAEVECDGVIAIVDNGFSCTNKEGREIAVGSFINGSSAAGVAQETENTSVCTANWSATPDSP